MIEITGDYEIGNDYIKFDGVTFRREPSFSEPGSHIFHILKAAVGVTLKEAAVVVSLTAVVPDDKKTL